MATDTSQKDPIVQYVVLRRDLWKSEGWPLGSVIAQACHASTASLWIYRDDPVTIEYTQDLDNMTKVVLEAKSLEQIQNLSQKLEEDGILHKLWIEQPENFATCLATKPYSKLQIAHYFKNAISRYSFVRQCKPRKDIEIVKRSEIKLKLEEKLIGLNRGIFGMKVVKKEEILALLEDLENCNEILKPTEQLEMVAGSKRTKLGLRQYVNLGEFIQSIDIQNSVAINVVNFTVMGLQVLNGALKIEAAFTPVSDRRVEISLQHASLEPETLQKLFENNFDLLLGIFNPAGWLDVTYVDDTHRIGRDDKDNIFYLERIP